MITLCVLCMFSIFFLMIRRPPRSTRTDTLFPYTTLFRSLHFNAVVGEVMVDLFIVLGRLQQRLGRNAAHVGARAAGRRAALAVLPGVDAGHRHTQLRSADRGNVPTRRSEERRVGAECGNPCRSLWSPSN